MVDDAPGQVRWIDLTVQDAPRLREFYQAVVGWTATPVNMTFPVLVTVNV